MHIPVLDTDIDDDNSTDSGENYKHIDDNEDILKSITVNVGTMVKR